MNLDDQRNQFHRLLLSPLFLLHDILGALIPGGLFLIMLGFKENVTIRNIWFGLPFGYKTNIGIALVFSYLIGKVFQIPWHLVGMTPKKREEAPENIKQLPEGLRKMLFAAMTDGVFAATPEIADKMAVQRAEGALYLGLSFSLVIASAFPGDGRFRILELLLGFGSLAASIAIFKAYTRSIAGNIGVGIANILARMSKEQLHICAAILKGFGAQRAAGPRSEPETSTVVEAVNEDPIPTNGALS